MKLEIKVDENVEIVDSIPAALKVIEAAIRDWDSSDDDNPLNITVEKEDTRGPPTLGVQAGEGVGTGESVGP